MYLFLIIERKKYACIYGNDLFVLTSMYTYNYRLYYFIFHFLKTIQTKMYIGLEVRIMVIDTDCTGSCKSNYLTIMTSVSVFRWVGGFFE